MMIKAKLLITTAIVFMSASVARADVVLPDVIGDAMVLQRDRAVPIWGKADPGEVVTVSFGKQSKKATADSQGKWRINLDPMPASDTPATMTIAGKNKIELKNILVGEVWLVSGQSNMQWTLMDTTDGAAAVASADHPTIRLFDVSRRVALKQESGPLGAWNVCTPQTVASFSGVGYYFGVELQKELRVRVRFPKVGLTGERPPASRRWRLSFNLLTPAPLPHPPLPAPAVMRS